MNYNWIVFAGRLNGIGLFFYNNNGATERGTATDLEMTTVGRTSLWFNAGKTLQVMASV